MLPFLLSPPHVIAAGGKLAWKCLSRTGELAEYGLDHELDLPDYHDLSATDQQIVYAAIARELLLLEPAQRVALLQHPHIAAARPFPGSPIRLDQLADQRAGIALFPLAGLHEAAPSFGLVAVLENESGQYYRVHASTGNVSGESWQLAHALAQHFATAAAAGRVALAKGWISTGETTDDLVGRIDLSNKTDISGLPPDRIWLVPADNHGDFLRIAPAELRFRVAATRGDAIAHVLRRGSTRGADIKGWPTDITELHTFVSFAKEPVIMAACLKGRGEITLWQSTDRKYEKNMEILKHIITDKLNMTCLEEDICSDDLAGAERTLLSKLETKLSSKQRILFNYTQGNVLMRSALLLLARRFPSLWLFYSNTDQKGKLIFDLIQFEGSEAITRRIYAERTTAHGVNWDRLLADNREREEETPEEWANYYFSGTNGTEALP
jgi:hypothetical protein